MKRIQLFEFEDFDWLPNVIRSGITSLIKVLHRMMGTSQVLAKIISETRDKFDFNQITDLGSGSGGPMIKTLTLLNESLPQNQKLQLLLTDKYPNQDVVERINNCTHSNIRYESESVDASLLGESPIGLKTMIASFHHMNPMDAKSILHSAEQSNQPILIYEIAKNNVPTLLWCLLLPLSLVILIIMSMLMTVVVRPIKLSQLLFTYLIPIIPIIYAWDGQASLMRTYTFEDIISMLPNSSNDNYTWEIKDSYKLNGKKAGYYILGHPKKVCVSIESI